MPVSIIKVYPVEQYDQADIAPELRKHAEFYTDCVTYKAMLPLLRVMKVFGMYHTRHGRNGSTGSVVYSAVICLLMLTTTARLFALFGPDDTFSPELFQKIVMCGWSLWCTLQTLANFRSWFFQDKAPEFMIDFHNLVVDCTLKHKCYIMNLRKRAFLVTILSVGLIITNAIVFTYFFVTTNTVDYMLSPLQKFEDYPSWVRPLTISLVSVNLIFLTAAWCLPIAFGHCVSYAIRAETDSFNEAFTARIGKGGVFDGDVSQYRLRHQAISKVIAEADDLLGPQISSALMCGLTLEIFLLYNTLWDERISKDISQLIAYVYWIGMSATFISLTVYDGATVNSAAHASLTRLHDINFDNHSNMKDLTEFTVFLNKLSGPPIGLSAIGLFVIDKPAILTTIGMFLTCFVIVVQFRMPSS